MISTELQRGIQKTANFFLDFPFGAVGQKNLEKSVAFP